MSDEKIRKLERAAQTGDEVAQKSLLKERQRAGLEPLSMVGAVYRRREDYVGDFVVLRQVIARQEDRVIYFDWDNKSSNPYISGCTKGQVTNWGARIPLEEAARLLPDALIDTRPNASSRQVTCNEQPDIHVEITDIGYGYLNGAADEVSRHLSALVEQHGDGPLPRDLKVSFYFHLKNLLSNRHPKKEA